MFLDPHEDAIRRIKSCLTEPELANRIIELDLVGTRSREGQPGWNLLAARGLSDDGRERRVEAIVDSFASALQWGERNNRALTLTTQATAALIELSTSPARRPAADDLSDTHAARQPRVARGRPAVSLSVPRRQFFSERFPRMAEEAITPVTNLIDRLRSSTQLAALLGSQHTTYDIAKAMNEGRIVLACPGAGGARDRLLANLLVFDLLHAAKGRAHIPPERRREFYVFLDEVQTYDGASSGNLAALLEQTAKYGIRGDPAEPEPGAVDERDSERADDQPLAPDRDRAERARRRADRPRVGLRPASERDHRPAPPHVHRAGHPPRRADPSVPVREPGRHRAVRRRAPPRASPTHTTHDRPSIRPGQRRRDDPSTRHARRAHPRSPRNQNRRRPAGGEPARSALPRTARSRGR